MIVTITMNPSIDISYPLEAFSLNTVNRAPEVRKTAGGKGLNVTRVLKQLKADVTASGLIGGTLGEVIKKELARLEIKHAFSQIKGETRNCIALLHDGLQTEILENGPVVSKAEAQSFLEQFRGLVDQASMLTFSGSLPAGLPKDFYVEMIAISNQKNRPVILDCSGESLAMVLNQEHKPLLIKPNTDELSELLGKQVSNDIKGLKLALSKPLFAGIEWIVVSMGSEGAFAKHNDIFYRVEIPNINVVNPVGSGDSTVAGLAYAIDKSESDEEVLKRANVLGMLNARESLTGHVDFSHYQQLFAQIKVTKV